MTITNRTDQVGSGLMAIEKIAVEKIFGGKKI
jgi:hypothetical protein